MFDTTSIGKKIKQARIDKNMTQMALADAMGVSYQAVSNWERGNSMPDISKLGDLCMALDLTVNELLGLEESKPNAVTKAMDNEELTVEEMAEVAPVLPPKMVRQQLDSGMKIMQSRLQDGLQKVSQRLEEAFGDGGQFEITMEKIMDQVEKGEVTVHYSDGRKKRKKLDLSQIADLAPYLDQKYLDKLIREADLSDLDVLEEIAPFLSRETLDCLVEQADVDDLDEVAEIVPFLSQETVDKLVSRCVAAKEFSTLEELAPFVSKETLDRLAENVQPDSIWEVVSIAPFFSRNALDTLVKRCEDADEFDALAELAPFVSKEVLDGMIDRYIEKGSDVDLEDIYPFLSKEALRKLAAYMMERKDSDALEDIMPFV